MKSSIKNSGEIQTKQQTDAERLGVSENTLEWLEKIDKQAGWRFKNTIDPADFECLFMQHGIEKEGLAFPSDTLNYYNGEPDNIVFTNDVAWGDGDSLSMPIAFVYGGDEYSDDVYRILRKEHNYSINMSHKKLRRTWRSSLA